MTKTSICKKIGYILRQKTGNSTNLCSITWIFLKNQNPTFPYAFLKIHFKIPHSSGQVTKTQILCRETHEHWHIQTIQKKYIFRHWSKSRVDGASHFKKNLNLFNFYNSVGVSTRLNLVFNDFRGIAWSMFG